MRDATIGGSVGVVEESGCDDCEADAEDDALILAESWRMRAAFDFTFETRESCSGGENR
jgi:hypothetical protein